MIIKIGIDSGKDNTKYSMKVGDVSVKHHFQTNVERISDRDGMFRVDYMGYSYIVGEPIVNLSENMTRTNKESNEHHMSVITAICDALRKVDKPVGAKVIATINMPLSEFKVKSNHTRIKDMYNRQYDLMVNDQRFNFSLEVVPYYEGAGIAAKNLGLFSKFTETAVLDFGSLNTNVIVYGVNGQPIIGKSTCLKHGINMLLLRIRDRIHEATGEYLEFSLIRGVITGEAAEAVTPEMCQIADAEVQNYLGHLVSEMEALKINTRRITVIASGGGATLLKNQINDTFLHDCHVDHDSLYGNATGTVGMLKNL